QGEVIASSSGGKRRKEPPEEEATTLPPPLATMPGGAAKHQKGRGAACADSFTAAARDHHPGSREYNAAGGGRDGWACRAALPGTTGKGAGNGPPACPNHHRPEHLPRQAVYPWAPLSRRGAARVAQLRDDDRRDPGRLRGPGAG